MDHLQSPAVPLSGMAAPRASLQPLKNPKYRHIARSAAKRESVQMLGSIKDLQLHFSRAGLEHREGAGAGVRGLADLHEGDEENQPPVEALGIDRRRQRPWKEVETSRIDSRDAIREARSLVGNVRSLWGLGMPSSPSMAFSLSPLSPVSPSHPRHQQDTRMTLVSTAEAIRCVRTLALSIHHPSSGGRRHSGPAMILPQRSKARSSISTPSRPNNLPRAVSYAQSEKKSSLGPHVPDRRPDELGQLRRAAIEILSGLRHLEERLRIEPETRDLVEGIVKLMDASEVLQRAVSPATVEGGSGSSAVDSGSYRATSTTYTEPDTYDSEEEEYNLNSLARENDKEHLLTWEERIVNENRLYKSWDQEEDRMEIVRESIRRWVGVVEGLFGVRDRAGMDELESWVKEDMWSGWSMGGYNPSFLTGLYECADVIE